MKQCMMCHKEYNGNGRKYCRDCKLKRVQKPLKQQPFWRKRTTHLYEIWLDGKVYVGQTCDPYHRQSEHNIPGGKFRGLPMQVVAIFEDEGSARRAEKALLTRYGNRAYNVRGKTDKLGYKYREFLRGFHSENFEETGVDL